MRRPKSGVWIYNRIPRFRRFHRVIARRICKLHVSPWPRRTRWASSRRDGRRTGGEGSHTSVREPRGNEREAPAGPSRLTGKSPPCSFNAVDFGINPSLTNELSHETCTCGKGGPTISSNDRPNDVFASSPQIACSAHLGLCHGIHKLENHVQELFHHPREVQDDGGS